jgi:flagellar protein FlaI
VLEAIARMGGMTQESVQIEVLRRKRILEWVKDTRVYDYREFSRVVSEYYTNPERVMTVVEEPSRD